MRSRAIRSIRPKSRDPRGCVSFQRRAKTRRAHHRPSLARNTQHREWTHFPEQRQICLSWFSGVRSWWRRRIPTDKEIYRRSCKDSFFQEAHSRYMVTGEVVLQYIDRCVLSDRYCIPMDKLNRAIQRAEEMFFGECDPGNSELIFIMDLLSSWSGQFLLWYCSPNSMQSSLWHWEN